jgi:hypothetical protein
VHGMKNVKIREEFCVLDLIVFEFSDSSNLKTENLLEPK